MATVSSTENKANRVQQEVKKHHLPLMDIYIYIFLVSSCIDFHYLATFFHFPFILNGHITQGQNNHTNICKENITLLYYLMKR